MTQNKMLFVMWEEATQYELPVFIKDQNGRTIFISYWNSLKAINEWRINSRHKTAKSQGKRWYSAYQSVLVKIESYSEFNSDLL